MPLLFLFGQAFVLPISQYSRGISVYSLVESETKMGSIVNGYLSLFSSAQDMPDALRDLLKNDGTLRKILELLAYETHCANYELSDEDEEKFSRAADLPEDQARKLLEAELGDKHLALDFLDYMHERSGLFSSRGGEQISYNFVHRSIQEYLAGCYMLKHDPVTTYRKHAAQSSFWTDAALLGVEEVIHHPDSISKTDLFILVFGLREGQTRKRSAENDRSLLWAGQISVKMLADLKTHKEGKKHIERLMKKAEDLIKPDHYLSAAERADAADVLDGLGYVPADLHTFIPTSHAPEFYISKYLVTNAQYDRFLKAANFQNDALWRDFEKFDENSKSMNEIWGEAAWNWLQERLKDKEDENVKDGVLYPRYWNDPRFGQSRRHAPVVGISWYEANAYCKWLMADGKLPEWASLSTFNLKPSTTIIRLPREAEWARATGEDEFSFGGKELKDKITEYANTDESGINRTTPVWMYPQGATKQFAGIMDMSGNVWEWQANYRDSDHDVLGLRGGSWLIYVDFARVSARNVNLPLGRNYDVGFRVLALPSGRF
jgi:formylglycine-generating enzyme required for sulfatase activity